MRSRSVIVIQIGTKDTTEGRFVEHEHVVQALPPNRTNDTLDVGPLPEGSRGAQHFVDTQASHLSPEGIAEDSIAVAQQVTWKLVKGERFSQLLSGPLRGWVGSHIAVDNATAVVGRHQKHVKNLEANGRHSKEVDGHQLLQVILQEGAPSLRRRFAAAHHVFAYAGLADVDTELEQLTVNPGCAPTRILPAHLADQISNLARNDGSSRSAASHLPSPEQAKAAAMPGNDGFWLDDGQRRAPAAPDAGQPDPQQAVPRRQFRAFSRGALKHADLVA